MIHQTKPNTVTTQAPLCLAFSGSLTLRNCAIGCYIRDYEQNGADRAKYGERLLENLSEASRSRASKIWLLVRYGFTSSSSSSIQRFGNR